MKKYILFIFVILLGISSLSADGFNDYRIKRRIDSKQRRLLKNAFFMNLGSANAVGNTSDLMDNGFNMVIGYQRRLKNSLTHFFDFSFSSHAAFNKLIVFQDDIGLADEITDIVFSQWSVDYGLRLYVPVFRKFSLQLESSIGIGSIDYNPTIAPEGDQNQLTDQFKDDLKNFLNDNDYAAEGFKPAISIGGGFEWLLFYRMSFGVTVASKSFLDGGNIQSILLINGSIHLYFEEIFLYKDIFK